MQFIFINTVEHMDIFSALKHSIHWLIPRSLGGRGEIPSVSNLLRPQAFPATHLLAFACPKLGKTNFLIGGGGLTFSFFKLKHIPLEVTGTVLKIFS